MWWWGVALAAGPMIRPEIGTDVPLAVSAGLLTEVGPRIRLRVAVGVLPRPYLRASNDAAQALFEGYTDPYRQLVEAGLDGATVLRVHGGWRPVPTLGLYAHGGWSYVSALGSATGSELVEAVTDVKLPPVADAVSLEAQERIHLVDVELGWEEEVGKSPFTVRVGLGWSFTAAAAASLSTDDLPRNPLVEQRADELIAEGEVEIERATKAYVHPPIVALALGWSFR